MNILEQNIQSQSIMQTKNFITNEGLFQASSAKQ